MPFVTSSVLAPSSDNSHQFTVNICIPLVIDYVENYSKGTLDLPPSSLLFLEIILNKLFREPTGPLE